MDKEKVLEEMDQERALFGMFFAFGNRLQVAGDSFYDEITCKQFFLLICLSLFQEQAPTINELSDVMGSSHQNVKQIINKLKEKGFVHIEWDKNDKRKMRIYPTDKVNELGQRYEEQEKAFMQHLYKGVSTEQIIHTLKVLQIMEKNLIEMKGSE